MPKIPMSCASIEYNASKMVKKKDQWREKINSKIYYNTVEWTSFLNTKTSHQPTISIVLGICYSFFSLIHWNWFENVKIFVEKWINEFRTHGIDNDWLTFRIFFFSISFFQKNQAELWSKLISGFVILLQCHLNTIMYCIKLFLSLRTLVCVCVCAVVLFLYPVHFLDASFNYF